METIVVEGLNPRKYNTIYKVYIACKEPVEYSLETLKAKASYITTAVDEDGIYNACKHYGWI